jgi:hypothetical protein
MADPELVKVLDYILNRCDENAIEAVSAAVVRRRRDLAMFGGMSRVTDPKKMAEELAAQIDVGATMGILRETARDMALRIIQQEAPELSEEQTEELIRSWVPEPGKGSGTADTGGDSLPADLLAAMIGQFTAYSRGAMPAAENEGLRAELGVWPERYWRAFPQVIRLIVSEYLRDEIGEDEFNAKIRTALSIK